MSIDAITGKLAVVSGKGVDMIKDMATTVREHAAVLRPFLDMCSESLSACYPDLYGDDAEMKGRKFDLLEALEKLEKGEDIEPALMESMSTMSQLVDFFAHMKRSGKGINESDIAACTADRAGLLSAIAIASSATDAEFGANAQKAIRAAFYAALKKDDDLAKRWEEKGISLPNLRMPVIAGEEQKDLCDNSDLQAIVADILSRDADPTDWKKVIDSAPVKDVVEFGCVDRPLKHVLRDAIKQAGGNALEWQVEAAGQGGCFWEAVGITKVEEPELLQALQRHPCGSHLTSILDKFNSPGDLLKDMQAKEGKNDAHRPGWEWKDVNWVMVGLLIMMHVFAVMAIFKSWNHPLFWTLWTEALILYPVTGALGITGGAHRLWSHRSYKAHFPARLVMMIANSIANQGSIFHWSRDHRVHHAKSDTEADPHDITRGFFYSHMGWLLLRKRQAVKDAGKKMDCSDLLEDPLVAIQHKLDPWWNQFFCFGLPTLYAWYRYDEAWLGFLVLGAARWLLCLHATWTVNSVAHTFGPRPYEPNMYPSESWFTTVVAVGEGYHNWHHTYPWDYSASELGFLNCFNPTTAWIDFLAAIGQAYGRRRAIHKKPKFA